ncbi:hypothetical protein B9Z19DRAFT_1095224 [Tuber borchii]|uniref:Uncharacterized protein n=1 Tax=Tuber borchii TaxID=42251 RepID=A0A2T6ZCZ0_TUBBO|nr:hypothetical protein B9Z19DRAFT_1095224 [Tuber borchii]
MNLSGVASCMQPPRFVGIRFKLIAIGICYLDKLVHPTPIFSFNFYSTKASRFPSSAQLSMSHSRHCLQALIRCDITNYRYLKKEKILAIGELKGAAKSIRKRACLIGPRYAYVKSSGETILDKLGDRAKQLEEELGGIQRRVERLQKEQLERRERALRMQQLEERIIAMIDKANDGDLLTDTALVKRGVITNTEAFTVIYGISPFAAQPPLLESNILVRMINKRATMLTNPGKYSRQWGKQSQKDFEKVLLYFKFANSEDWKKFEEGNVGGLPQTRCWLRIAFL